VKKRIVIALVACLALMTFAATASAATAAEKDANFRACLKSAPARLMIGGPSVWQECCEKAGGKYEVDVIEGTVTCTFTSDRLAPSDLIRPQNDPNIVVTKP
jgi:hypothetical protein